MGKSQETYNKKEKEKQRLKKKKDKLQRKEERKSNVDKGKSLEDMFAYVDEFGNFSTTPPERDNKKTSLKVEDIQIGATKREDPLPEELIRRGRVNFFNESKGYGFIRDTENNDNVFVHANSLETAISEGDIVSFETERTHKGLSAIKVKVIK